MALFSKKQKTEVKAKEAAPAETKTTFQHPRNAKTVLKQPWFSERATALSAQNKYVFLVSDGATKPSVKDEIQRRYGVRVTAVNIIRKMGKMKRFKNVTSRRIGIKKAIVTLKPGDKIEIQ
jgi:large subunit ribosomal protein L23